VSRHTQVGRKAQSGRLPPNANALREAEHGRAAQVHFRPANLVVNVSSSDEALTTAAETRAVRLPGQPLTMRWLPWPRRPKGLDKLPPPDPDDAQGDFPFAYRDASVRQSLEIMREVSAEQRARARHLDTKAGTLAGFAGTVLALNAGLGGRLLSSDDKDKLTDAAQHLIRIFLAVSTIALGLAAFAAVAGALRPMGHEDLNDLSIERYARRPKVVTDPHALRMTWLQTLARMTSSDRRAGAWKARSLMIAVSLLAVGLAGVAGQGLTLVFWNG
jgi:hypothetical protein